MASSAVFVSGMELSAWPNCHSACQYALILFPSVWRNLCGLIYFVSVVIGYLIQLIMHLTEAASHCVSGLNSLCEAECIFRCLCTQNWNQIIFVISWKWKRCHLIWLRLNQHLLHKTLCNYLGSRDWRKKREEEKKTGLLRAESSSLSRHHMEFNKVFSGILLNWSRCARFSSFLCV